MSQPELDKEMEAIRSLIHQRLNSCPPAETMGFASAEHLDEDALNAFVESRVSENESSFIVSHLIECPACRDASARLIRLESLKLDEDDVTIPEQSPSRLRQWLEGLAAQVVPSSGEDAVFAYQNPDTGLDADDDDKPQNKDSATEPDK